MLLLGGIFGVWVNKKTSFNRHPLQHTHARILKLKIQMHTDYQKIHGIACACMYVCMSLDQPNSIHNRKFDITIVDIYAVCNNVTHVSHCYLAALAICVCAIRFYIQKWFTQKRDKVEKKKLKQNLRLNKTRVEWKEKWYIKENIETGEKKNSPIIAVKMLIWLNDIRNAAKHQ